MSVRLQPIAPEKPVGAGPSERITAAGDVPLVLVRPSAFTMGASRREQGRRSNETLRSIELRRPYYIGVREITNEQFRAFRPGHQPGDYEGVPMGLADRPVVEIAWEDAARFCNWLSVRDGLPPAYVEDGDTVRAVEPLTTGYRLPTEAEWAYAARYRGPDDLLRYPWGDAFPPRGKAGNYADESAARLFSNVIEGYDDGHAGPAPVGSYDANARGLHDLGGNAAEWCHDFYAAYPYDAGKVWTDPAGPAEGRHHVIRGSSWRQASISALRLAYRDYGAEPRNDVGFRICRYLDDAEEPDEEPTTDPR